MYFLDHRENKELLTKSVVQQVFKRIASLLNAGDENVRIEAGAGYENRSKAKQSYLYL